MEEVKGFRKNFVIVSVFYVIAGVILLFWPNMSVELLSKALSIGLLVLGLAHVVIYFTKDHMENIMNIETVALDDENSALVIIDQTQLPYNVEILKLTTQESIWDAIYLLKVRGAPAIGVAAAIGMYIAATQAAADDKEEFLKILHEKKEYLNSARPTAVNVDGFTILGEYTPTPCRAMHKLDKAELLSFIMDMISLVISIIAREVSSVCSDIRTSCCKRLWQPQAKHLMQSARFSAIRPFSRLPYGKKADVARLQADPSR